MAGVVAIDDKVLRRSFDTAAGRSTLAMVTAFVRDADGDRPGKFPRRRGRQRDCGARVSGQGEAMSAIEKGIQRYQRFKNVHLKRFGRLPSGRLLDFGCGAGAFVIAALRDGIDVHGVEVEQGREVQFRANAARLEPTADSRLTMYDGRRMPFSANSFDGCYSWFVFEHVTEPQTCLREIVRVLKPGGTLSLFADDARNCWDGHAMAPWPPYLPREFAAAYAEGLGMPDQAEFLTEQVVYISAPIIIDILTTLGMQIVYANSNPKRDPALITESLNITKAEEARALGRKVAAGRPWESPIENLTIFAVKA